ncbi:MAG TPA: hypothetical protein VFK08_04235 [Rhodanobacteraceae bacterium]|nr:hypothetical protein [Rhodanobacteraceae bacterium]
MNPSPEKTDSDRELVMRAREIHSQACANVDARTHAQLAAARRNAMAAARAPSRKRLWLPAAGALAACALAAGVVVWRPASAPMPAQDRQVASSAAELPLDTDSRQMDLYQNLEFYQWLAQQPDTRAPTDGAPQ